MAINTEERFWSKVSVLAIEDCWLWQAQRCPRGYGRFRSEVGQLAHRYSYYLKTGVKPPSGLCVMHSCDNPSCVNPNHLSLGSWADNTRDAARKGRMRGSNGKLAGNRHPSSTVPDEVAAQIYTASGTLKDLVSRFGVRRHTVADIRTGRKYASVTRGLQRG